MNSEDRIKHWTAYQSACAELLSLFSHVGEAQDIDTVLDPRENQNYQRLVRGIGSSLLIMLDALLEGDAKQVRFRSLMPSIGTDAMAPVWCFVFRSLPYQFACPYTPVLQRVLSHLLGPAVIGIYACCRSSRLQARERPDFVGAGAHHE